MNWFVWSVIMLCLASSATLNLAESSAVRVDGNVTLEVNEEWAVVYIRKVNVSDASVCAPHVLNSLEQQVVDAFPGIRIAIDASNNLIFAAPQHEAAAIRAEIARLRSEPDDPRWLKVYSLDGLRTPQLLLQMRRTFPGALIDIDDTAEKLVVLGRQSEQAGIEVLLVDLRRIQARGNATANRGGTACLPRRYNRFVAESPLPCCRLRHIASANRTLGRHGRYCRLRFGR